MRTPTLGESDLLLPLHEGVFEQPMWRTFLDRLRRSASVDHAAVLVQSSGGGDVGMFVDSAPQPEGVRLLAAGLTGDEARERSAMREGRVYAVGDLGGSDGWVGHLLAPLGLADLRAMRVRERGGLDAWLLLLGRKEIGASAGMVMSMLSPHLTAALRVYSALEVERSRAQVGSDAFRRMNFGWVLLDGQCRIVDADAQAERVLERSGLLRRAGHGRLMLSSPGADRELTRLVGAFAESPDSPPRAINLSHDPWTDILVAPHRAVSPVGTAPPVAAVYLKGDRSSSSDRHEQLAELFRLSPSEARLAWSMAQGMTIKEAAAEHGLTLETARNYSKKIYAKTGARGQADVVRHILTSVLALA